jgi:hypothetical protein
MKLSRSEMIHLRNALRDDLKNRTRQVKICNQGTSDEVLAERIQSYNGTKNLLDKVIQAIDDMDDEGRVATEVVAVGDDSMYTV